MVAMSVRFVFVSYVISNKLNLFEAICSIIRASFKKPIHISLCVFPHHYVNDYARLSDILQDFLTIHYTVGPSQGTLTEGEGSVRLTSLC